MTTTQQLSENAQRGVAYTVLAALLFGVNGAVAADLVRVIPAGNIAQLRSVLAALVLGLIAYRRRAMATGGRLLALAGFGLILAIVTVSFFVAISRLGVGPGVTIQFSGPVLVLCWMRLVNKRPVPMIAWLAAVVALAGVALVSGAPEFGRLDPLGLVAAAIAATSFAAYIILSGFLGRSLPTITIAAYGFSFSGLFLLAAFRVVLPPATPRILIEGIWLVLLGTVVPFLLEVAALRMTDPGTVGVVATLEPVVAATAAWWWLEQSLAPLQVFGGLLVVGAVARIQRYSSRPPLGI
ncbi:MAG TPA: EamA family transporter [Acidimicrobiia bacterium]|nr:EamA family transporter [Acidimicrobiia bacterium]